MSELRIHQPDIYALADKSLDDMIENFVKTFLAARFSGADRHRHRLAKVAELEN